MAKDENVFNQQVLSKSIFITGGTGLLGQHVISKALELGFGVKALKRKTSTLDILSEVQQGQVQWIEGDILDVSVLEKNIEADDVVIHAAAIVSYASSGQNWMYKTNVEGTANIVNACLQKVDQLYLFAA